MGVQGSDHKGSIFGAVYNNNYAKPNENIMKWPLHGSMKNDLGLKIC